MIIGILLIEIIDGSILSTPVIEEEITDDIVSKLTGDNAGFDINKLCPPNE